VPACLLPACLPVISSNYVIPFTQSKSDSIHNSGGDTSKPRCCEQNQSRPEPPSGLDFAGGLACRPLDTFTTHPIHTGVFQRFNITRKTNLLHEIVLVLPPHRRVAIRQSSKCNRFHGSDSTTYQGSAEYLIPTHSLQAKLLIQQVPNGHIRLIFSCKEIHDSGTQGQ